MNNVCKYYLTLEDRLGYTEVWGVLEEDADRIAAHIHQSDLRSRGAAVTFDKMRLTRVLTGDDGEFWGDLSLLAPAAGQAAC